jgi:hypothetical protein
LYINVNRIIHFLLSSSTNFSNKKTCKAAMLTLQVADIQFVMSDIKNTTNGRTVYQQLIRRRIEGAAEEQADIDMPPKEIICSVLYIFIIRL